MPLEELRRAGFQLDAGLDALAERLVEDLKRQRREAGGERFPSVAYVLDLITTLPVRQDAGSTERNAQGFQIDHKQFVAALTGAGSDGIGPEWYEKVDFVEHSRNPCQAPKCVRLRYDICLSAGKTLLSYRWSIYRLCICVQEIESDG